MGILAAVRAGIMLERPMEAFEEAIVATASVTPETIETCATVP
jgi:hypothetical protein